MLRCHLLRVIFLCLLIGSAGLANAADLFRGMTEDEVIAVMGNPNSSMGRASKMVLMYGDGELELRAGRLYSAKGYEMDYLAPDEQSQFAYIGGRGWTLNGQPVPLSYRYTVENRAVEKTIQPPAAAPPETEAEAAVAEPTVEPDMEYEEYDDYDMDEFDEYYDDELYAEYELTPMEKAIGLAIRFFITLGLTIFIIKMAFEQKGFPVLIPQLLMVSVALSITSLGTELIMEAMNVDLWQIAQLIDYLALTTFIYLFTDVKQAQTAMTIALIARSVTFVVNWVLLMILLNYGFGY